MCRFEGISRDGYDPQRVMATTASLRKYVAEKSGYEAAEDAYRHPLWAHLINRAEARNSLWLTTQLKRYRILRFEHIDESHAITLGLASKNDHLSEDAQPPLDLERERFATLDGLLFLLLLYREAQDAAHVTRVKRLEQALRNAAEEFALAHQYRDEVWDTWTVLLETRMVAWTPLFAPDADSRRLAEEDLRDQRKRGLATKRTRSPVSPEGLKANTRSGRRWRRQVWIRACCVHFYRRTRRPSYDYRDADEMYVWLLAHREAIRTHISQAMDSLMDCWGKPVARLPPLHMPPELYSRRQRPILSERDLDLYIFGCPLYDVIPVVSLGDCDDDTGE